MPTKSDKAARKRIPTGKKAAVGRKRASSRKPPEEELPPAPPGTTSLVIVESPAKARTIGKYLGRGYRVKATVGHIMDLPEKKLGIDIEGGFEPELVPIPGKEKTIAELKSAAEGAREIFLATDPDREGEAIAYHVAEQIKPKRGRRKTSEAAAPVPTPPIRRVLFHEITKDAVRRAIENAGKIDEKKVEAQQARRVLDRLVGYKASPVLWRTVKKGISAGRVQTVALRLIVEREREIRAFNPEEYWSIEATLEKKGHPKFTAKLHQIDGKKASIANQESAERIMSDLRRRTPGGSLTSLWAPFPVTEVKRRERRKNPSAPFTTSTLQQEAAKKLGFGSKRTMRVAQDLYEGVELGDEGSVGLITYMRTDSTRIAETAAGHARDYLRTLFGEDFLATGGPRLYGADDKRKNTQDAHEAIRPTDPAMRPEHVKKFLTADQFKLYQLIWQRFMASQMAPAVFDTTTVDFELGESAKIATEGSAKIATEGSAMVANGSNKTAVARSYLFRSTGSIIKFQGFLVLYREAHEPGEHRVLEDEQPLPPMEKGELVPVLEITPNQHFTEPPPRYSEASLVKELERLGIGRPSTYAAIVSVLVDRRYVLLEQRRFTPTELGEQVEKVMVKQFPDIFNVGFTSEMEEELDKVEDGDLGWQKVLKDFYTPFEKRLNKVDAASLIAEAHDLSKVANEKCPECGGALEPRGGFFGPFLACERHPKKCKYTRPIRGEKAKPIVTDYLCHLCGSQMVIRTGRTGQFLGCSTFPKCRGTRSLPTGVMCPKDGGDIVERRSRKRGTAFYACANEDCDFVVWNKPVKEKCPECGYIGAEAKTNKTRGEHRKCLKCANEWDVPEPEGETPEPEKLAG